MAKRGRPSAASLCVTAAPVSVDKRLPVPAHLSDAEGAVWAELIADQPADAFLQTHAPLIEMYCRHVVNARIISETLLAFDRAWLADEDGLKRYDKLLQMAERESRAASSLATRLRITRQAIDHPETARNNLKGRSRGQKPWELSRDGEA